MAQYIDKAAVETELQRRLKSYKEEIEKYSPFQHNLVIDIIGKKKECEDILSFINNLEVKEVKEADLEKIWKEYFKYRGDMATVNVKHLAKHFYELGLKAKGE